MVHFYDFGVMLGIIFGIFCGCVGTIFCDCLVIFGDHCHDFLVMCWDHFLKLFGDVRGAFL